MYHARQFVATVQNASGEIEKEVEALKESDEKTKVWVENWCDGLTYCMLTKSPYITV